LYILLFCLCEGQLQRLDCGCQLGYLLGFEVEKLAEFLLEVFQVGGWGWVLDGLTVVKGVLDCWGWLGVLLEGEIGQCEIWLLG
jgi:hypothetical protein